ncbi:MAG: hypothetical protein ABI652_07525 [Acidobacteriota bacterium]|jgi:hypothetical protein
MTISAVLWVAAIVVAVVTLAWLGRYSIRAMRRFVRSFWPHS